MSLDDLEREIDQESEKSSKEISEAAEAEVERILGEAHAKARANKELAEKQAHEKIASMQSEFESLVYMECRDAMLKGIEGNVKSNIKEFKHSLIGSFEAEHYHKFLSGVAKTAAKVFADYKPSDVVVEGNKHSLERFAKSGYTTNASKNDGVLIKSKDGRVVLNATFDRILEENGDTISNAMSLALKNDASKLSDVEGIMETAEKKHHHETRNVQVKKKEKLKKPVVAKRRKGSRK